MPKVYFGRKSHTVKYLLNALESKTDECQEWPFKTDHCGYGVMRKDHRDRVVHRIAYELCNEVFDPKLYVLHHCDNPPCFNPRHLWQGAQLDNMRDMQQKGRRRHHQGPLGPNPRIQGENHYRAKVSSDDVRMIRLLSSQGMSNVDLAKIYNTGRINIGLIVRRLAWKHIE